MTTKKRMTAQSVVNVKAAASSHLDPVPGGYVVVLTGQTGKTVTVKDASGDLVYTSMATANKSISTHNPALVADLKPEI
jgi:hypothetical protein